MKWKLIESQYDTECSECSDVITLHDACYWKREKENTKGIVICTQCYKRYGVNEATTAVTATTATATTTPPSSPPAEDRQAAIAKAHAENMAANTELVMAVRQLTVAVNDRTRLLVKNMEAKP